MRPLFVTALFGLLLASVLAFAAEGPAPARKLRLVLGEGPAPAQGTHTRPYINGKFEGRIAWSADGNHNDPDDWIASPMALAIFAEAGLKERLVHFDYNCILPLTNLEWGRAMCSEQS